jgi:hypothetical protein
MSIAYWCLGLVVAIILLATFLSNIRIRNRTPDRW